MRSTPSIHTCSAPVRVRPGFHSRGPVALAAGVAFLMFGACAPPDRVAVEETRERVGADASLKTGVPTAERFALNRLNPADYGLTGAHLGQEAAKNPFQWETPEGWKAGETSRMRVLNFTFGPEGEGECYLTVLPGGGGGVAANVNRWRAQMGLPELPPGEVEALEQRTLLGAPATYVDLAGDFKGVGEAESRPDYRMIGLIQEHSGFMFFVKMTGPAALVTAEEPAFRQFTGSLTLGSL